MTLTPAQLAARDGRITTEYLRSVLSYDPDAGKFTWLGGRSGKRSAGRVAGTIESDGYRRIRVFFRKYHASVLAWFYMTGEWPTAQIDHINLNRSDDRWGNLRAATVAQNGANRRSWRKGHLKGTYLRQSGRWEASIQKDRKWQYLGTFATEAEAHAVYCAAAARLHGDFARFS